jgi:hypothetical protein
MSGDQAGGVGSGSNSGSAAPVTPITPIRSVDDVFGAPQAKDAKTATPPKDAPKPTAGNADIGGNSAGSATPRPGPGAAAPPAAPATPASTSSAAPPAATPSVSPGSAAANPTPTNGTPAGSPRNGGIRPGNAATSTATSRTHTTPARQVAHAEPVSKNDKLVQQAKHADTERENAQAAYDRAVDAQKNASKEVDELNELLTSTDKADTAGRKDVNQKLSAAKKRLVSATTEVKKRNDALGVATQAVKKTWAKVPAEVFKSWAAEADQKLAEAETPWKAAAGRVNAARAAIDITKLATLEEWVAAVNDYSQKETALIAALSADHYAQLRVPTGNKPLIQVSNPGGQPYWTREELVPVWNKHAALKKAMQATLLTITDGQRATQQDADRAAAKGVFDIPRDLLAAATGNVAGGKLAKATDDLRKAREGDADANRAVAQAVDAAKRAKPENRATANKQLAEAQDKARATSKAVGEAEQAYRIAAKEVNDLATLGDAVTKAHQTLIAADAVAAKAWGDGKDKVLTAAREAADKYLQAVTTYIGAVRLATVDKPTGAPGSAPDGNDSNAKLAEARHNVEQANKAVETAWANVEKYVPNAKAQIVSLTHTAAAAQAAGNPKQKDETDKALAALWASVPPDVKKKLDEAIQKVAVATSELQHAQQEARGVSADAKGKLSQVLLRLADAGPVLSKYIPQGDERSAQAKTALFYLQLWRGNYDAVSDQERKLEWLVTSADPNLSSEEAQKELKSQLLTAIKETIKTKKKLTALNKEKEELSRNLGTFDVTDPNAVNDPNRRKLIDQFNDKEAEVIQAELELDALNEQRSRLRTIIVAADPNFNTITATDPKTKKTAQFNLNNDADRNKLIAEWDAKQTQAILVGEQLLRAAQKSEVELYLAAEYLAITKGKDSKEFKKALNDWGIAYDTLEEIKLELEEADKHNAEIAQTAKPADKSPKPVVSEGESTNGKSGTDKPADPKGPSNDSPEITLASSVSTAREAGKPVVETGKPAPAASPDNDEIVPQTSAPDADNPDASEDIAVKQPGLEARSPDSVAAYENEAPPSGASPEEKRAWGMAKEMRVLHGELNDALARAGKLPPVIAWLKAGKPTGTPIDKASAEDRATYIEALERLEKTRIGYVDALTTTMTPFAEKNVRQWQAALGAANAAFSNATVGTDAWTEAKAAQARCAAGLADAKALQKDANIVVRSFVTTLFREFGYDAANEVRIAVPLRSDKLVKVEDELQKTVGAALIGDARRDYPFYGSKEQIAFNLAAQDALAQRELASSLNITNPKSPSAKKALLDLAAKIKVANAAANAFTKAYPNDPEAIKIVQSYWRDVTAGLSKNPIDPPDAVKANKTEDAPTPEQVQRELDRNRKEALAAYDAALNEFYGIYRSAYPDTKAVPALSQLKKLDKAPAEVKAAAANVLAAGAECDAIEPAYTGIAQQYERDGRVEQARAKFLAALHQFNKALPDRYKKNNYDRWVNDSLSQPATDGAYIGNTLRVLFRQLDDRAWKVETPSPAVETATHELRVAGEAYDEALKEAGAGRQVKTFAQEHNADDSLKFSNTGGKRGQALAKFKAASDEFDRIAGGYKDDGYKDVSEAFHGLYQQLASSSDQDIVVKRKPPAAVTAAAKKLDDAEKAYREAVDADINGPAFMARQPVKPANSTPTPPAEPTPLPELVAEGGVSLLGIQLFPGHPPAGAPQASAPAQPNAAATPPTPPVDRAKAAANLAAALKVKGNAEREYNAASAALDTANKAPTDIAALEKAKSRYAKAEHEAAQAANRVRAAEDEVAKAAANGGRPATGGAATPPSTNGTAPATPTAPVAQPAAPPPERVLAANKAEDVPATGFSINVPKEGSMVIVLSDPTGQTPTKAVLINGWNDKTQDLLMGEMSAFKKGVVANRVLPAQRVGSEKQASGKSSLYWNATDGFFGSRNLAQRGWSGPIRIEPPTLVITGEKVVVTASGAMDVIGSSTAEAASTPPATPANTTPLGLNSFVVAKPGDSLPVVDVAPNSAVLVVRNTKTKQTFVVYGTNDAWLVYDTKDASNSPLKSVLDQEITKAKNHYADYSVATYYNGTNELGTRVTDIANRFKKFNAAGVPSQRVMEGTRLVVPQNGEVGVDDPLRHNVHSLDEKKDPSGKSNDPLIDRENGYIISYDPNEPLPNRKKLNVYAPTDGVIVAGVIKTEPNKGKMGVLILDPAKLTEDAKKLFGTQQPSTQELRDETNKLWAKRVGGFVDQLSGGEFSVLSGNAVWNGNVSTIIRRQKVPSEAISLYLYGQTDKGQTDKGQTAENVHLTVGLQPDPDHPLERIFKITYVDQLGSNGDF